MMLDEDLVKAAILLARHAKRHNLPEPVLTVAPAWYDQLRLTTGLASDPQGHDETRVNFIKVEVDYERRWER